MPTQMHYKVPRQVFVLQALYFESLRHITDLTKQERELLQKDLQYAKANHHLWQLGKSGRGPQVPRIFYLPAEVDRTLAVITVKSPGEPLPDKPYGDARDFLGYLPLHDPEILLLAIRPSARESEIVSAVRKHVRASKKRRGKTRSSGGGRKYSTDRMEEALKAYGDQRRDRLSVIELGERAQTFPSIPKNRKGTALEHDMNTNRGHKLLNLAKQMIATARKGSVAWVVAFPCVNEEPLP
jgi:hypothetical protein